ncbi:hypothetical protein BAB78_25265 [Mycobacteroides abscessus]|nr:hypothetical protein A3O01_25140 [Mycobacteroides abscessus]ANO11767.1 hypothetical protein BAB76_25160 [Mycobacteroides abscessus]ANO21484.1 hypothetical protein BAB78_25265 [Mycobacteroides abscessus]OLT56757.1 hypothetical protein BKG55_22475 [Mycobacteroides abscessus ATCC 19977]
MRGPQQCLERSQAISEHQGQQRTQVRIRELFLLQCGKGSSGNTCPHSSLLLSQLRPLAMPTQHLAKMHS